MHKTSGLVEHALIRDMALTLAPRSCAATAGDLPVNDCSYHFGPLRRDAASPRDTCRGTREARGTCRGTLRGIPAEGRYTECLRWDASSRRRPGSIRYGDPSSRTNGRTEYVVSDYLGSTRLLIDDARNTLQELSQRPFGVTSTSNGSGARTSYIGREHDNETDLGFFGVRLYEPEYGRFLSTDVLWGEFQNLTPYHYSENSPIVKKDPSGEFPWGVVIGAAVEIASQMIFENRSVSEIDGGRVAIAATAGGLTVGLSAFSSTATRVAGAAVISVAEGAGKRAVSGEETTASDVVTDAAIGGLAGKGAESLGKSALGSAEGKMVKDQLRRAENAVADGRLRPAQIARAEAAMEALSKVGRGPRQDLLISVGKEGTDKLSQVVFSPIRKDNTSVSPRTVQAKP